MCEYVCVYVCVTELIVSLERFSLLQSVCCFQVRERKGALVYVTGYCVSVIHLFNQVLNKYLPRAWFVPGSVSSCLGLAF